MKDTITEIFRESIAVKEKTLEENIGPIGDAVHVLLAALKEDKKVLFFGNGGSAADSQHWAAELIGRFRKERQAFPAIALTTDTSALTALGNDYSFDIIFARQIEGLGRQGDVAVAISTSGRSENVLAAVRQAKKQGLKTIAFTGGDGGELAELCDISLVVPSKETARIQEAHLCMAHAILQLVEEQLKT